MTIRLLFLVLLVGFASLAIFFYLRAIRWLAKRKVDIRYPLISFFLPKYLNQYKEMSLKENGKVGFPFYGWIVFINLALVCFILWIVLAL